jgi:hypothetical protein
VLDHLRGGKYQTDQPRRRRHTRAVQDARKNRIRAASPTKKPDADPVPFPTGGAAGAKFPGSTSDLQTARSLGPRRLPFNASSSSIESMGGSPKCCALRRIDRSKLGSIDFGIVGSGAMRPDSGAGRRLDFRSGRASRDRKALAPTKLCDVK